MAVVDIDASEQCYDLAKREIANKNFVKAEKLLDKSLRLYPSNKQAEILLAKLKDGDFTKPSSSKSSSPDGVPRRRPPTAPAKPEEPKLGEDYTQEQLDFVTKLKK